MAITGKINNVDDDDDYLSKLMKEFGM